MRLVVLLACMGLTMLGVAFFGLVTGRALDLGKFGSTWVSLLAEPTRFYFAIGISIISGICLAVGAVFALLAHLNAKAAEDAFTTQAERESRKPLR